MRSYIFLASPAGHISLHYSSHPSHQPSHLLRSGWGCHLPLQASPLQILLSYPLRLMVPLLPLYTRAAAGPALLLRSYPLFVPGLPTPLLPYHEELYHPIRLSPLPVCVSSLPVCVSVLPVCASRPARPTDSSVTSAVGSLCDISAPEPQGRKRFFRHTNRHHYCYKIDVRATMSVFLRQMFLEPYHLPHSHDMLLVTIIYIHGVY